MPCADARHNRRKQSRRLLPMAQTWFAWSDGPYGAESLQDLLQDFNDQQMIPAKWSLPGIKVFSGSFGSWICRATRSSVVWAKVRLHRTAQAIHNSPSIP